MQNYTIVRSEHLNHHGFLFGGAMLSWVDEFSWIAASLEFPGRKFVTRAMDDIEFKTGVANGSIVRFDINLLSRTDSSLTYRVEVYAEAPGETAEKKVFTTKVTFVSVDEKGQKTPID